MSDNNQSSQRGIGPRSGGGRYEKANDPKTAIKRLMAYLLPYKKELLLVAILIILSTFLSLISPYLVGRSIDVYIIQKDVTGLRNYVLLLETPNLKSKVPEATRHNF
jgi:ATP-binding cassette subfamily B protein